MAIARKPGATKSPVKKKRGTPRVLTRDQQLLLDMAEYKRQIEALQAQVSDAETELIGHMEEREQTTIEVRSRGKTIKGTVVKGKTIIYDEPALAKKLGAQVWRKVTALVLDKSKLEEALKDGVVDALDVAACATEKDKKPYLRVTAK